jgi:hypothetical protein
VPGVEAPGTRLPARPRRAAPPPRAHGSPDRTNQPVCTVQSPGTSGCSPAGTLVTVSADICTSPSVMVPLVHSTTVVPDGVSSVDAVDAGKPQLDRPSAAAPSATEPTRSRQRGPRTLCSRIAISISLPGTKQPARPRTVSRWVWGRFRSGSPQTQATNSAPADRCLPEMVASCCCDPWCLYESPRWVPSPTTSGGHQTTESEIRQPGHDAMWRRSHILGGWNPRCNR